MIEIDPPHLDVEPWSLVNSVSVDYWDDLIKDLHNIGAIYVEECKPTTGCWYVTFPIEIEPIDLDKIELLKKQCCNIYQSYQNKAIE